MKPAQNQLTSAKNLDSLFYDQAVRFREHAGERLDDSHRLHRADNELEGASDT
jgi:hypothetical protein